jgi:hypothetical protein
MSITSPADEHNGAEQWMEHWRRRREAQLRELVTPEVLEEFRLDPHGARGRTTALAQILNFLRMQPIEDRVFAYAEVPFERYKLGSMHAERGVPPEIDEGATFATEDEAIYAVFVRRLELLGIAPAGS